MQENLNEQFNINGLIRDGELIIAVSKDIVKVSVLAATIGTMTGLAINLLPIWVELSAKADNQFMCKLDKIKDALDYFL